MTPPFSSNIEQHAFSSSTRSSHSTSGRSAVRPVTSPSPSFLPTVRLFLSVVVGVLVLPDFVLSHRWMSPCGGSTTVDFGGSRDVIWTPSRQEMRHSFRRLSEKSSGLKRKVRDLKQQYVSTLRANFDEKFGGSTPMPFPFPSLSPQKVWEGV